MDADRLRFIKVLFIVNAVLIGVVGGAVLGMVMAVFASDSGPDTERAIIAFSVFFFPIAILWSLFTYGAYKGFQSKRVSLQVVFWLFIIWNLFNFPIGTIFSAVVIYYWNAENKQKAI